jgi:protein SCO1
MDIKTASSEITKIAFLALLFGFVIDLMGSPAWAASSGSALGANYFPNVELVTQDGRKVRFYDDLIKGKVFALNFIYTRCTDSCPLETAALLKVQKSLGEHMGKDVFFYSVSVDGDRDNPSALKEYADKFKVGPGWLFLSGKPEDVVLLRQKLSMYRDDGKEEKALNEHNINILMGNERAGQWIKRSPFEEPKALVRILGTRLQTGRILKVTENDEPERAPPQSPGETLFRSKCETCHSVGNNDDGLGPGLKDITKKRDRAWLVRWIKTPDKLLREKDPIAIDLYNRFNKIVMPNLKLNDNDAEALIDYLDSVANANRDSH